MAVELYVGLSNLWKHWHMKGANTQMRTGYVYAVRTCSVAVLWTSICCSIFNSQIIAWHSATGIHITISIIFFKLSSLFYYYYFFLKIFSTMFYKAVLVMFCLLLETVICQFGVSPAMPIWMLKWLCNCDLFMRQPTFLNLVRLHHFAESNN